MVHARCVSHFVFGVRLCWCVCIAFGQFTSDSVHWLSSIRCAVEWVAFLCVAFLSIGSSYSPTSTSRYSRYVMHSSMYVKTNWNHNTNISLWKCNSFIVYGLHLTQHTISSMFFVSFHIIRCCDCIASNFRMIWK